MNNPKTTTLQVEQTDGETPEQAVAKTALKPSVRAAVSMLYLNDAALQLDLPSLVAELETLVTQGTDEEMLRAQAATLDAIFHTTLRRALVNMEQHAEAAEALLKLGLRAQQQCLTTLQSLKNSRGCSVSINQANIAHNQQVNNFPENELLGATHERLDTGATTTASRADSPLEALGAIYGSQDLERQMQERDEL